MSAHGIGTAHHIDQLDALQRERKNPSTAHGNYLEQAGDLAVVNTFLKVLSLVLVLAVLAGAGATYRVVEHYRDFRPIVVRVDSVGKAEAVAYGEATYHPEEKELRYFLSQWAQFYYARNRFTVRQDFPKAFFFMDTSLAGNVINSHQQAKDIEQFLANPAAPNTYIEVTQITLDHLSQPPYSGTIEFTAKQVSPNSEDVVSSSRYTASVQFIVRPDVPNNVITVNPLGFTIVAFHDQQAFN